MRECYKTTGGSTEDVGKPAGGGEGGSSVPDAQPISTALSVAHL